MESNARPTVSFIAECKLCFASFRRKAMSEFLSFRSWARKGPSKYAISLDCKNGDHNSQFIYLDPRYRGASESPLLMTIQR